MGGGTTFWIQQLVLRMCTGILYTGDTSSGTLLLLTFIFLLHILDLNVK